MHKKAKFDFFDKVKGLTLSMVTNPGFISRYFVFFHTSKTVCFKKALFREAESAFYHKVIPILTPDMCAAGAGTQRLAFGRFPVYNFVEISHRA
jgi:hypothetical protein